jgi:hypothetical protein
MTPRSSNRRDGSGSLAFPASSSTFRRCRPGPRGVPFRRPLRSKPEPTTLLTLASPSKRSPERWSRLAAGPPLMRFACPSTDMTCARPLPGASSLRPDAAKRRVPFRPRGFAPPRRLPPHTARGFVAPRSRSGVHRVSDVSEPVPSTSIRRSRSERWRTSRASSPRRGSHPSKSVLVDSRSPRHRGSFAFLPFPARPIGDHGENRGALGPGEPGAAAPPTRSKPRGDPLHGPSSRVR